MECDVSSEDSVIKAFDFIKNNIGSVHVLVNNAGGLIKGSMLSTYSWKKLIKAILIDIIIDLNRVTDFPALKTEQLEQTINVNILGVLYCTRQAINIMKEGNQEGHIVNVGRYVGLF